MKRFLRVMHQDEWELVRRTETISPSNGPEVWNPYELGQVAFIFDESAPLKLRSEYIKDKLERHPGVTFFLISFDLVDLTGVEVDRSQFGWTGAHAHWGPITSKMISSGFREVERYPRPP
jgi:hypothetical protein